MKHQVFNFSLFTLYIVLMTALMIWQGIGIAPDRYAFVLLLGSLLVRRTRSFILDWIPFLFILISYDFLRGFADNLSSRVHISDLIYYERSLFGFSFTSTSYLQETFYKPGNLAWYDFLATIFYFIHFALPLGFGFLLWIYNKSFFKQFVTGILLLSYGGWITYIIFPAAPPWMASQEGYLPGVVKIMDQTSRAFPVSIDLPTIYHQFNPNPVAAIPSMHAAYPFLILLFSLKFFKLRGLYFLLFVLAVWFSLIYLGEHYLIDILAGAVYAAFFFLVAKLLHSKLKSHLWLKKVQDKLLGLSAQFAKAVITLPKKTLLKQKTN